MGHKPGVRAVSYISAIVVLLALNAAVWLRNHGEATHGTARSREEVLNRVLRDENAEHLVSEKDLRATIKADKSIDAAERELLERILDEYEVYVREDEPVEKSLVRFRDFAQVLSPAYEDDMVTDATEAGTPDVETP